MHHLLVYSGIASFYALVRLGGKIAGSIYELVDEEERASTGGSLGMSHHAGEIRVLAEDEVAELLDRPQPPVDLALRRARRRLADDGAVDPPPPARSRPVPRRGRA